MKANAGFAAGIGQRSRVTQLAWALKGAKPRRRDHRLSPLAAVAECRKLRDRVTALMQDAKADPQDAMVFCVFAAPDLSRLVPEIAYLPPDQKGLEDLEVIRRHADKLPIGFLVFVLDRSDAQRPIFGHARPLIVEDPRGIELCQHALDSYAEKITNRITGGE